MVLPRAAGAAARLIVVPWRPELAFDTALCAAKSWLNRVRLVLQLSRAVLHDPWLEAGEANGLTFLPLLSDRTSWRRRTRCRTAPTNTPTGSRATNAACSRCAAADRGMATLEVGPHPRETGVLAITQLKGRHNMPAALDGLAGGARLDVAPAGPQAAAEVAAPERSFDQRRWRELMAPYRQARGGAPWMPALASPASFAVLDVDMADLARRAGVSSWLFT